MRNLNYSLFLITRYFSSRQIIAGIDGVQGNPVAHEAETQPPPTMPRAVAREVDEMSDHRCAPFVIW